MATNLWRFGYPATSDYIDLPEPQVGGASVSMLEIGGSARSRNGTLLVHRTGPVKRSYSFTHDPNNPASEWQDFLRLYQAYPGPFELYDPTIPNMISVDDRLGIGWVTATGTAVTATSSTRMAISASPASVQTAISASPAAANLSPVLASTAYSAGIRVEAAASFTGTFGVYGYTSTPTGSGTLQGSTVALTTNGRYAVTFTTGAGIVYVELRAVRTAGSANLCDPNISLGPNDPGASLRLVSVRSFQMEVPDLNGGNVRANITSTMEEV